MQAMWKRLAALACCLGLTTGCGTFEPARQEDKRTREQRVAEHFSGEGPGIAAKERLPSPPQLSYLMVDEDRTDDGRVRSLWATAPGQILSRCFYLDTEKAGTFVQGVAGCGGGPDQARTVSLSGAANDKEGDLVGDVGSWPASSVSISADGLEATVPVKNGYFLVPVRVTTTGARAYDLNLLDADATVIGQATGVKAPMM
jgi:hypothetical protein